MHSNSSQCHTRKNFFLIALLLFTLSCFLHFFRLDSVPPGFFTDESSIGYNAWSILSTGRDEYGNPLPVFFKCFGNYHEPVMVYTLVPFIKVFGLSKWTVRFPEALYMVLASVLFYFLGLQYTRNKYAALAWAFVFSITPWAFVVSRSTMSGYTPMLCGIVAGCYFLRRMVSRRSGISAVFAGLSWAFAMYAHNCGRPTTAAYLICFVLAFNIILLRRIKIFVLFVASLFLATVPMMMYYWNNSVAMTARFKEISVWKDSPSLSDAVGRIAIRYVEYFSPHFLFIAGDPNPRHNTGTGVLYLFMVPFVLAGLYRIVRYFRRNPYYRFILLALLVYPCAAMLTEDHFHSTRSLNGMPFWLLTSLIGADFMIRKGRKFINARKILTVPVMLMLVFVSLCVSEVVSYFQDYFAPDGYGRRSMFAFNAPLASIFEYCAGNLKENETLYLSRHLFASGAGSKFKPYTDAGIRFFLKIPPDVYQREGMPRWKIRFYNGGVKRPGILVSPNFKVVTLNGHPRLVVFREKLPVSAKLEKIMPLPLPGSGGRMKILFYRISP